ncbi:hypothetical protein LR48_Vigan10g168000 [Vigna angularis]|uniref:Uncharacterized protein n=1 Tax=Phaseolus angularis TaxID=3914 RepID=A0A0L9VLD9_PHAAN|nr:hypothetical protein LR48_Vigan10g168000 [Vigna angularis]
MYRWDKQADFTLAPPKIPTYTPIFETGQRPSPNTKPFLLHLPKTLAATTFPPCRSVTGQPLPCRRHHHAATSVHLLPSRNQSRRHEAAAIARLDACSRLPSSASTSSTATVIFIFSILETKSCHQRSTLPTPFAAPPLLPLAQQSQSRFLHQRASSPQGLHREIHHRRSTVRLFLIATPSSSSPQPSREASTHQTVNTHLPWQLSSPILAVISNPKPANRKPIRNQKREIASISSKPASKTATTCTQKIQTAKTLNALLFNSRHRQRRRGKPFSPIC